jgi:hypothetical protein
MPEKILLPGTCRAGLRQHRHPRNGKPAPAIG